MCSLIHFVICLSNHAHAHANVQMPWSTSYTELEMSRMLLSPHMLTVSAEQYIFGVKQL